MQARKASSSSGSLSALVAVCVEEPGRGVGKNKQTNKRADRQTNRQSHTIGTDGFLEET